MSPAAGEPRDARGPGSRCRQSGRLPEQHRRVIGLRHGIDGDAPRGITAVATELGISPGSTPCGRPRRALGRLERQARWWWVPVRWWVSQSRASSAAA